MRKYYGLLLILLVAVAQIFAQVETASREAAQAHYDARRFIEAAALWAEIASDEPHAIDAPINAAQSYLQIGELGQAMLYYRRAHELNPRHEAVQVGLALVRALRVDIQGDDNAVLSTLERLTADIFSYSELTWLVLLAWTSAFFIGCAAVIRQRWRRAALAAALVAGLMLVLLVARDLSRRTQPAAVVSAFEAMLYHRPDSQSVPLSRIYAAAEVRIADRRTGWVLVTLPDGRAGWLIETAIAQVSEF